MNATQQAKTQIPTPFGNFEMIAYSEDAADPQPHLALVSSTWQGKTTDVPLRIHSECLTGDVFQSRRCDCGEQLGHALKIAGAQGGIVIYLRQEGRGIGLINKLNAYNLQDLGADTSDANTMLGLEIDSRDYSIAIQMLQDLGITSVQLMTNNPLKIQALEAAGIRVKRLPIIMQAHSDNTRYLATKQNRMGHLLDQ